MAYVLPNQTMIRPPKGKRYVHRQVKLTVSGTTASAQVSIPCPGRLIGLQYGAVTGGALTIKADSTAGVQIWTDADISTSSASSVPAPVGTTAQDEGGAATAATDGFSGGLPVRTGVFLNITGGTNADVLTIDLFFRLCTYFYVNLVAQSGADGSGAVTRFVDLNGAGVLAAIAIDYSNTPATADLLIKADSTSGWTLYTRTNSNTDVAPTLLGRPGVDEAINASAATDGTECANAFKRGLFFDLAQTDAYTSQNETTIVECWIDN